MKHKQCQSLFYSEQLLLVKQELENTRAALEEEDAQHSKTRAALQEKKARHSKTRAALQEEKAQHRKTRAALQQATSDLEKTKGKLQTIKTVAYTKSLFKTEYKTYI